MKIKECLYENLTPDQRVKAHMEAVIRGDETERQRLRDTCPRKTYTQCDTAVADKLDRLWDMAIVTEMTMRGHALNILLAERLVDDLDHDPQIHIDHLHAEYRTYLDFLEQEGIDPDLMAQYLPTLHPWVGVWVDK